MKLENLKETYKNVMIKKGFEVEKAYTCYDVEIVIVGTKKVANLTLETTLTISLEENDIKVATYKSNDKESLNVEISYIDGIEKVEKVEKELEKVGNIEIGLVNSIQCGFDIDVKIVEICENEYTILNDGCEETYLVFENEEKAKKYTMDYLKDWYKLENEFFLNNLPDWLLLENIDNEGVKNWWSDFYEEICWNEAIEDLVGDETLELIENGELDEDETREGEFNARMESIECSEVDELVYQLGKDEFIKLAINNGWIDVDNIFDDMISYDGIGHYIASYDGEEQQSEINEVVAYRID